MFIMATNTNNIQDYSKENMVRIAPEQPLSENYLVVEHLQRMPNIFARGLFYLILLLVIVSVAYICLANIDIVIKCQAVARPASHKIRILSDRNGYITQVFITEGQTVKKDMPLFLVRSKETVNYAAKVEELRKIIPLTEQNYDTKTAAAVEQQKHSEERYQNAVKVLNLKLEQNKISVGSIDCELTYRKKEVKRLSQELARSEYLFENKDVPLVHCEQARSNSEQAQMELRTLDAKKVIALKEKCIFEEDITRARLDFEQEMAVLKKQIKNLELEKFSTLQSMQSELETNKSMLSVRYESEDTSGEGEAASNVIRADQAGTVSELYFRNGGEYIRESDLLCTIVPSGSPLHMEITVANRDIGFVEDDLDIKYKFDAFPFTDYGTIKGSVAAISPSAVEDRVQGFVYRVQGALQQKYFEIKDKQYPIKAGMTATAELVTERKTILSILFKKVRM